MILTTTLNASVDKSYRLSQPIEPGSVMRVAESHQNAGGKGLNAARAVQALGGQVMACGFIGGNNGKTISDILDMQRVPHSFTKVSQESRCCINVVDSQGCTTELLEPGPVISPREQECFLANFQKLLPSVSYLTLNGSLPQGLGKDFYASLIELARQNQVPCLLDASGEALQLALAASPYAIKPNTDEIAQLIGRKPETLEEVVQAAIRLRQDHHIHKVIVSLGRDGAIMASKRGVYRGRAASIQAVNPVGSGDTLIGAFALAQERQMADEQALAFAMAAASANCLSRQVGSFQLEASEELLKTTKVTRIA